MKLKVHILAILMASIIVAISELTDYLSVRSPTPQISAAIRIGIIGDITTTNTICALGRDYTPLNEMVLKGNHGKLFTLDPIYFSLIPQLADPKVDPRSMYRSGSPEFAIKIRQGLLWSDGTKLTAEDVAFSYNAILKTHSLGYLGGYWFTYVDPDFLDHVEVLDRYTVKFVFREKPGIVSWEGGLLQAPIFQKAYWEPIFKEAWASVDPVQTLCSFQPIDEPVLGPFALAAWVPESYIQKVANPHYPSKDTRISWYEDPWAIRLERPDGSTLCYGNCDCGGPCGTKSIELQIGPFVDEMIFYVFESYQEALEHFRGGAIDAILHFGGGSASGEPTTHSSPHLAGGPKSPLTGSTAWSSSSPASDDHGEFRISPSNSVIYVGMNLRRTPFEYPRLRQALQCLVDKEFLAEELFVYSPEHFIAPAAPAYSPIPGVFPWPWHRDLSFEEEDKACIGLDREERLSRAKQLLLEAGFRFNEAGILVEDPEGNWIPELELLCPAVTDQPSPDFHLFTTCLFLKDRWSEIIPIRVVRMDPNQLREKVYIDQDFDMWLGSWWNLSIYPSYLETFFTVRNTEPGGFAPQGAGGVGWESWRWYDEYEPLAHQFLAAKDLDKSRELAFKLQEILAESLPWIPLYYPHIVEQVPEGATAFASYPFSATGTSYAVRMEGKILFGLVLVILWAAGWINIGGLVTLFLMLLTL